MFSCQFSEIFIRITIFQTSVKACLLFLSIKFWAFTVNGRDNSFTMKELRHRPLKIPECVNRVVAYESTPADKNMFKVIRKGVFQEWFPGFFMLYLFPAVLVFCKMNMFLLSSLPNMIGLVAGGLVGMWSVVSWLVDSVVRGFNKTQEKTWLQCRFRLYTLVEVYFVILILFFSILTIKKKQIWLSEAVTWIFYS